jgi:hypothetical protein
VERKRQAAGAGNKFGTRFAYFAPNFFPTPPQRVALHPIVLAATSRLHGKRTRGRDDPMQEMKTHVTSVPNGDDEGGRRLAQLAERDRELGRDGERGWVLHSTHLVVGGDRVTFVDTLTRTTETD